MTEEKLKIARYSVAGVASFIAVVSLALVWRAQPCKAVVATIILLWTLGPPIWFAAEYMMVKKMKNWPAQMEDLKAGQELAGKFWAAIAASLFAIYQLYNK